MPEMERTMSGATCAVSSAGAVAVSERATEAPPPSAGTRIALLNFGRDTVATSFWKPSALRRDVRLERIGRPDSPACPFLLS